MKKAHYLLTLGCFFLLVSQVLGQGDIAREMNRLQDEYIKGVAAATEPLSRKYQASLEQLLKRAELAKDTESVAKIQEQLNTLQAAAAGPNAKPHRTREWVQQLLISSEWTWSAKAEFDRSVTTHVTFNREQFLMGGKPFCSYKIIDPLTVELDKKILKFADDYKSFEVTNWSDGNPRFGHRIN